MYLPRLANYSLLEPERVRLGTMCGMTLWQDFEKTSYGAYFDLKDCGDDFYFNNVIRYVKEITKEVTALPMDEGYLREIVLSAHIVILAAEFCKLRMGNKIDAETAHRLRDFIDIIYDEFKNLWNEMNYEKGIECFLGVLEARKADLERFI